MKVKRSFNRTIAVMMVFAMLFASLSNGLARNVKAAVRSEKLGSTYLNTTVKYLNFGQKDTTTYDFNINKEAQNKGAVYTWYVYEGKGDQGVVTINSKTGIVTAKKAGTAYIRCKITLADGTILRPQAKVIVRNNITAVDISNIPENQIIYADEVMNFNRRILNTDAGKGKLSKGITRWEIKEDTSGIDDITENGVLTPTGEGTFSVRAVCFQSNEKYVMWLKDKEANQEYITAASKWYKLTVKDSKAAVIVATQEELDKALVSKDITQIKITTEKEIKFIIAEGDYLSKTLIVDAPNADVDNYAVFKNIIIRAIKENTWNENANGNSFYVTSIKIRIIVNGQAEVKEIIFDTESSTLFLEIEGTVHQITILQPLELNLSGNGEQIPITIEKTGDGSKITTSIPLNIECDENFEVILNQGAEGTTINKSESAVEVKVQNNSNQSVLITTDNTGGETINAGESGVSNGTERPATPVFHATLSSMTINTPATKTTYLVGDTLDIAGLVIGGTYSNGRKQIIQITAANITGFNSSAVTASQLLTITVDGKKATYTIEIKPVLVTNISISPAIMTLTAGGATGALFPTIYPANATNKVVTWSSSDETIATVNNGVITPIASGTALITATTEDGSKTATCEVTVNLLILSTVNLNILAGSLTGTTVLMEYSIDSTNGIDGSWTNCTAENTSVAFGEGKIFIRAEAEPDNFRLVTILAAPPAPTLVYDDVANSITGLGNTYEYRIDSGAWISGDIGGSFTGTKEVQIRLKATADFLPSQIQTIDFTTNLDLTEVGINVAAGNITGTTTLMQYSLNSTNGTEGIWVDCEAPSTAVTFAAGKVYVRAKIQPLNFRLVATLSIPAAPTSGVTYSIMAGTIGNLAGIYEYSINGGAWSTAATGVVFEAGPVTVRTKATADALPSMAETIVTIAAEVAAPALVFDDVANSITGLGNTYEYKIDAGAWTSGEITGDFKGTKTVQIRLKAAAHVLPSQIQTINFTTNLDLTGAGINVGAGNITGTTTLMQYSLNSTNGTEGIWVDCTTPSTAVTFAAGKVYVRAKIQPLNFRLVATLSAPAAPTSGVNYSIMAGTIGNLAGIFEYSINGGAWSTTATGVIFEAGPITVRTKATADALPSLAETIATIAAEIAAPTLVFDDVANSITGLGNIYEYNIDAGAWTSGEVDGDFTGTKIVQIRLKATADVLPSQIQTIDFTTNLDLTGVGIMVGAGSITGTTILMQYSLNSTNGTNGVWADCSTGTTLVTFDEGPVYVRANVQPGNFRLVGTVTPFILSVIDVTSTTTEGYYKAGSTITIYVVFGGVVIVTGTPTLSLETGDVDRLVSYAGSSGGGALLIFNYTVQAGDISSDLDYTTVNALNLNGGTIKARGTVFDADLILPSPGAASSLGYSRNFIIDNSAPTSINISAMNTIPGSGNVTLTAVGGPLSTASWNSILNQIKSNTNVAGNWVTGITADKLTITPSAEGSTATLNNTNTSAATIVKDFIIPASLVVDKAGNTAAGDIRINSCNSSVTSIAITNSSIVYSINNGTPDLYVAYAKTAGQLKNSIAGLDESPQTYTITDSADNPKNDASILLLGDKLIVTSESGLSQKVYPIRVAPKPITTIQLTAAAPYALNTVIDNSNKLYILARVTGMTVGQIKSAVEATDGSAQTYVVTDLLGQVINDDGAMVSSSNRLVVTAYDGVTKAIYEIRVDWALISMGNISVVEGNSGTVNAVFILRKLGDPNSAMTLPYSTEYIMSGVYPANEESDYMGISGDITFAEGEVIKTLTVQIIGDTVHEDDEVFRLKLTDNSDPSVPVPFSKTCTIINDD